jgi:hypothetical protein
MKPIIAASLLVLTLAACGGPSEEDVLTPEKIRASESAPELPDIQLSENPEPPPAPPKPEEPLANELDNAAMENVVEIETQGTVPPAFQALWGRVPSDCRPGMVSGTGLLIGPDSFSFADSTASLQAVLGDYPERFTGRFADDAGTEHREELVLTGSSNVLIRTSDGQRMTYHRCRVASPTG